MKAATQPYLILALTVLFGLTVVSLAGQANPNLFHVVMGILQLVAATVHWALSRTHLRTASPVNRRIDQFMMPLYILCNLSGLGAWFVPSESAWDAIHPISGVLVIVLLGLHLLSHWKVMGAYVRRVLRLQPAYR